MLYRRLSSTQFPSAVHNLAGSAKSGRPAKEPPVSGKSRSEHGYKVKNYACVCGVAGALNIPAAVCLSCLLLLVVLLIAMLTTSGSDTY